MLIVVHFSHLMYLDLNSELRQFERQYRNISVGFAIDLSVTCQCRMQICTDTNICGHGLIIKFAISPSPD